MNLLSQSQTQLHCHHSHPAPRSREIDFAFRVSRIFGFPDRGHWQGSQRSFLPRLISNQNLLKRNSQFQVRDEPVPNTNQSCKPYTLRAIPITKRSRTILRLWLGWCSAQCWLLHTSRKANRVWEKKLKGRNYWNYCWVESKEAGRWVVHREILGPPGGHPWLCTTQQ